MEIIKKSNLFMSLEKYPFSPLPVIRIAISTNEYTIQKKSTIYNNSKAFLEMAL